MQKTDPEKKYFTKQLLNWHVTANYRALPWKSEQDPYRIWLSEVILQQTRALQGLPYYIKFIESYPEINDLALADDEAVFRLWQGLGYYNRCRNMLATARYVVEKLNGVFPDSYEGLLALKGIGPYTAAAIASFAYSLPHAVVDGNVYRVLARYFAIETPFDSTEGKKQFSLLAQELLARDNSSGYNQAIMDLGATVCTPRNPQCEVCPLKQNCIAYRGALTGILPVRSKVLKVRKRYFHYLLLKWKDTIWIHKRTANDIWQNLNEPFLIENDSPLDIPSLINQPGFVILNISYKNIHDSGNLKQRLTHQIIETRFFTFDLLVKPNIKDEHAMWLNASGLKKAAFPKTVVTFLENNLYF